MHIGLYDKFVGSINFEADVNAFPLSDDFWAGHVLLCKENRLVRGSWHSMLMKMCEDTNLLSSEELEAAREFERQQMQDKALEIWKWRPTEIYSPPKSLISEGGWNWV